MTKDRTQVTFVGEGPMKAKLEKTIQDLKLSQQIEFTEAYRHADTPKYYQKTYICCLPSVREFGETLMIEASGHSSLRTVVNHEGSAGITHAPCMWISHRPC